MSNVNGSRPPFHGADISTTSASRWANGGNTDHQHHVRRPAEQAPQPARRAAPDDDKPAHAQDTVRRPLTEPTTTASSASAKTNTAPDAKAIEPNEAQFDQIEASDHYYARRRHLALAAPNAGAVASDAATVPLNELIPSSSIKV